MSQGTDTPTRAPLLSVEHLTTAFPIDGPWVPAVNDVSFALDAGETLALVGESGCGKSLSALSIMRLVDPPGRIVSGAVRFDGRDLLRLTEREMRAVRGASIGLVLQEPMAALNPVFTIGSQIVEALEVHGQARGRAARARAIELLDAVRRARAGAARRRVPAPALGRLAPARADRRRARLPAAAAHRRRADDGARRDDSGGDPRPAARPQGALRSRPPADHPRPRHRRAERRPRHRHVRRTHRRGRAGAGAVPRADTSLHRGTAAVDARTAPAALGSHAIEGAVPRLGRIPDGCAFAPRCAERFEPVHGRRAGAGRPAAPGALLPPPPRGRGSRPRRPPASPPASDGAHAARRRPEPDQDLHAAARTVRPARPWSKPSTRSASRSRRAKPSGWSANRAAARRRRAAACCG